MPNHLLLFSLFCYSVFVLFLAFSIYSRRCIRVSRLSGGFYCAVLISFASAINSVISISKSWIKLFLSSIFYISVSFSSQLLFVLHELLVHESFSSCPQGSTLPFKSAQCSLELQMKSQRPYFGCIEPASPRGVIPEPRKFIPRRCPSSPCRHSICASPSCRCRALWTVTQRVEKPPQSKILYLVITFKKRYARGNTSGLRAIRNSIASDALLEERHDLWQRCNYHHRLKCVGTTFHSAEKIPRIHRSRYDVRSTSFMASVYTLQNHSWACNPLVYKWKGMRSRTWTACLPAVLRGRAWTGLKERQFSERNVLLTRVGPSVVFTKLLTMC